MGTYGDGTYGSGTYGDPLVLPVVVGSTSRADALAYISGVLGKLASTTGTPLTDTYSGFADAINAAMVALGVDPLAGVVSADDANDFRIVLRYTALRRVWLDAASRVDIQLGSTGARKAYSQLMSNIKVVLDQAALDVLNAGIEITLSSGMMLGSVNLDILEPSSEAMTTVEVQP